MGGALFSKCWECCNYGNACRSRNNGIRHMLFILCLKMTTITAADWEVSISIPFVCTLYSTYLDFDFVRSIYAISRSGDIYPLLAIRTSASPKSLRHLMIACKRTIKIVFPLAFLKNCKVMPGTILCLSGIFATIAVGSWVHLKGQALYLRGK